MRILIVGAGSIGSSFGGFMAKAGHNVTLVSQYQAHMDAIARDGLRITGIWGDYHVTGMRALTSVDSLAPGQFDLIIISVKSYDTAAAANSIKHLVDDHTLVVSYQNGLGNAERIAEAVGWHRTVGARVIYGVKTPEPGLIEITVIAEPTALGVYSPDTPAGRVREIVAAMEQAGLPTVYTDAVATKLWQKVTYNCALNPLSALLDVNYGRLAESPPTLDIMRNIIFEVYAVGHAMNVPLDPPDAQAYFDRFINVLIPPTAAHYASMREDVRQGRKTEIDALNGAICRYGQAHNIPTPANLILTRLMAFFEPH
ncbi:MAG TPA: 2-dehydropantoate 2-reductase [Candidatus Bathyarchaeia archaeon]|nr:2-dehydropantoate 2-reductase [Candidatus Bathyarchaeia archaeon]